MDLGAKIVGGSIGVMGTDASQLPLDTSVAAFPLLYFLSGEVK